MLPPPPLTFWTAGTVDLLLLLLQLLLLLLALLPPAGGLVAPFGLDMLLLLALPLQWPLQPRLSARVSSNAGRRRMEGRQEHARVSRLHSDYVLRVSLDIVPLIGFLPVTNHWAVWKGARGLKVPGGKAPRTIFGRSSWRLASEMESLLCLCSTCPEGRNFYPDRGPRASGGQGGAPQNQRLRQRPLNVREERNQAPA